jgi:hypothetical protein
LPGGIRLFLDSDTKIRIAAVDEGGPGPVQIIVEGGKFLLEASGSITVANPFGAEAGLGPEGGLLGVIYSLEPFRYEADCLRGACHLKGDLSEQPLELAGGQAGRVGGSGRPEDPFPARYDLYITLAPGMVPTPTATSTPTRTPPPTSTRRPTNTSTPQLLPTWTRTSVPTSTPLLPTSTPVPPPPPTDPPPFPTDPPPTPTVSPPPPPPTEGYPGYPSPERED